MSAFVKIFTKILGIVLTLVGIAGFFVDGYLLMFEVDTVHNIVHLVTGILALSSSSSYKLSRTFLLLFGFIYGVVAIVGFVQGDILGLFHANDADNVLHAVIAGACLLIAFTSKKKV